jgi:hypothetical protein
MNTSRFVSGSSVLLAGWLGATFLNEVPAQRYPKLDKATETTALPETEVKPVVSAEEKTVEHTASIAR